MSRVRRISNNDDDDERSRRRRYTLEMIREIARSETVQAPIDITLHYKFFLVA